MNEIVNHTFLVGSLPEGRDHRCPPGCWAGVGPGRGSLPGRRSTYPQHNTIFSLQGSYKSSFHTTFHTMAHGPNIYKDTKPWISAFLKNWPVKVLGGRCLSVWGPLPSYDPILPPPLTHGIRVYRYIILIHTRKGGRANQRECYWTNSSQSRSKIPTSNMTDCISSL